MAIKLCKITIFSIIILFGVFLVGCTAQQTIPSKCQPCIQEECEICQVTYPESEDAYQIYQCVPNDQYNLLVNITNYLVDFINTNVISEDGIKLEPVPYIESEEVLN